jgi:hypothetical protein
MGRREDGAAVRTGRRCASNSPGRPSGEPPPSIDAAPRVEANVASHSRAMAGLRSRAIRPGARSWLTSVAGPRFESAARPVAERRSGAPEGASFLRERGDAFAQRPTGRASQAAHRGPRKPQRLSALRSPLGEPRFGRRTDGSPGAGQRTRAMALARPVGTVIPDVIAMTFLHRETHGIMRRPEPGLRQRDACESDLKYTRAMQNPLHGLN